MSERPIGPEQGHEGISQNRRKMLDGIIALHNRPDRRSKPSLEETNKNKASRKLTEFMLSEGPLTDDEKNYLYARALGLSGALDRTQDKENQDEEAQ